MKLKFSISEIILFSLYHSIVLEKEMATHSSVLENPMNRGVWQARVHKVARVGHDLAIKPPPPQYYASPLA